MRYWYVVGVRHFEVGFASMLLAVSSSMVDRPADRSALRVRDALFVAPLNEHGDVVLVFAVWLLHSGRLSERGWSSSTTSWVLSFTP